MPTIARIRAHLCGKKVNIDFLLSTRQRRSLSWIEADCNDVIFFSNLKRQDSKRCDHAVQHLSAKHWTIVVNERNDNRLFMKELAQLNWSAILVIELKIQRQLLIQLLLDLHIPQGRG